MGIRLDGAVAIITGGGGAIGGAQARLLGDSGASVVVADVDLTKAEAVAADVRAAGGLAIACTLDVRDGDRWAAVVGAAEGAFGPVTALANNAGANVRVSFDEQTEQMWDRIVGTILTGSFLGIKAVVPSMPDGGRIVALETGTSDSPADERVDHRGRYVVPGFIDIHVHGVDGHDTLGHDDDVAAMARRLPRYGVTAFCPTTVACSPEVLATVLAEVQMLRAAPEPGAARVLPAHLESNRSEEHTSELQSH